MKFSGGKFSQLKMQNSRLNPIDLTHDDEELKYDSSSSLFETEECNKTPEAEQDGDDETQAYDEYDDYVNELYEAMDENAQMHQTGDEIMDDATPRINWEEMPAPPVLKRTRRVSFGDDPYKDFIVQKWARDNMSGINPMTLSDEEWAVWCNQTHTENNLFK